MRNYHLAVDIGASSGRLLVGWLEDGRLCAREVYRFPNGLEFRNGHLCWDYDRLFAEVVEGLRHCHALGMIPSTMGVDTWGVDFVLLDADGRVLGDTVAYRDSRTEGVPPLVAQRISEAERYARTGIQEQPFNTIYQLFTVRDLLPRADAFLMTPDYFHFRLTGVKRNEYTNATTTGLVNARTRQWDEAILDTLGYPRRLFGPLQEPGTVIGTLRPELAREVGFSCQVLLPPTHDTAAAVLGAPLQGEGSLFLSSGTWSLMGAELVAPITTEESRRANFTNEGGYGGRYRFLKNIMGLWMIQCVRQELGEQHSFAELTQLAEQHAAFPSVIDVTSPRYLAPASMIAAIQEECRATGQPVPAEPGELAQCIFHSLARCYAATVREIAALTGRTPRHIAIAGGGSKNGYLNRLTARETGLTVTAGPTECTALGNLAAQMIATGELRDAAHAREVIGSSFDIEEVIA